MSNPSANPLRTFHYCITGYVVLLGSAAVSGSELIKTFTNAAAILLFIISLVNWLFYPVKARLTSFETLGLTTFYVGIAASTIINSPQSEFVDSLKISIAPLFFAIGAALANENDKWTASNSNSKLLFALLVLLPLLAWAVQLLLGTTEFSTSKQVGIFVNRNNAGLYAIALLGFYCAISGKAVSHPLPYLIVGLLFGTLGLLISVVGSLIICTGNVRHFAMSFLAGLLLIITSQILPEPSAALRIKPVLDSVGLLISNRINLETVTYADLFVLLNTNDLSFIFRLKHWHNLMSLYFNAGWMEWLFGFGSGASIRLSTMQLVPHNDYIRVLFEFGAIAFLGFMLMLINLIRSVGRGWALVPLVTIFIYFISENLINNYIAMVFFFFSAGAIAHRARPAISNKKP